MSSYFAGLGTGLLIAAGIAVYRWIKSKPVKDELAETQATLKTLEVINEQLRQTIPKTAAGRLSALNGGNSSDE